MSYFYLMSDNSGIDAPWPTSNGDYAKTSTSLLALIMQYAGVSVTVAMKHQTHTHTDSGV